MLVTSCWLLRVGDFVLMEVPVCGCCFPSVAVVKKSLTTESFMIIFCCLAVGIPLKCTWQAFGRYIARSWQVYSKYMASIWQAHGLAIYLLYTCEMQLNYGSTTAQRYGSSSLRLALPPHSRMESRQFGGNAGPVHKVPAPKYFPGITQALPKFYPSQKGLGELGYYLGSTWVLLG